MTRLSVNINKIATLRNSRGGNMPDVIKSVLTTELNIEGNPIPAFVDLVLEVVPAQVTLVPDAADAITSNAGWNTLENKGFLTEICTEFKKKGIRTSIFIDPLPEMAAGAAECGCDRVELFTEGYAKGYAADREKAIAPYVAAANEAARCGLGLNAGHDLNLDNLEYYIRRIPFTDEVSIGHAIICDALYMGLEKTVEAYLQKIRIL